MKKETLYQKKVNAVLISIVVVLLTAVVITSIILIRSIQPARQAKREAIEIAQQYARMDTVDKFYWFSWEKSYFSVLGTDQDGKKIAAIIPQSGEDVKIINQDDGYDEKEIRTIIKQDYEDPKVKKANLGMYEDEVVWEIITEADNGHLTYYLLSFETGEELKAVSNI